jgi:signal transduction histidine kinase
MKAHQGTITFDHNPGGGGTVFTLCFPGRTND